MFKSVNWVLKDGKLSVVPNESLYGNRSLSVGLVVS